MLYKISCVFSTIVLNVQYDCTKRWVQLYAMLSIYYITCSFCLCFTFLLALYSVVLTNLLAKAGLVELAAPKKQEERHCCHSSIYVYSYNVSASRFRDYQTWSHRLGLEGVLSSRPSSSPSPTVPSSEKPGLEAKILTAPTLTTSTSGVIYVFFIFLSYLYVLLSFYLAHPPCPVPHGKGAGGEQGAEAPL